MQTIGPLQEHFLMTTVDAGCTARGCCCALILADFYMVPMNCAAGPAIAAVPLAQAQGDTSGLEHHPKTRPLASDCERDVSCLAVPAICAQLRWTLEPLCYPPVVAAAGPYALPHYVPCAGHLPQAGDKVCTPC